MLAVDQRLLLAYHDLVGEISDKGSELNRIFQEMRGEQDSFGRITGFQQFRVELRVLLRSLRLFCAVFSYLYYKFSKELDILAVVVELSKFFKF
jgi:hypothetical protein